METTLGKKSISALNKFLSDNLNQSKLSNDFLSSIDYKLKNDLDASEHNSIKKISNDDLFNNKIRAYSSYTNAVIKTYFKQTQNWIGHILEISDNSFTARLDEIRDNDTFEIADFDFNEVSLEDQKLIALGSIFYMSVGFAVREGQVIKESFIRFQRLPPWNLQELDNVIDNSSTLRSKLKWDV